MTIDERDLVVRLTDAGHRNDVMLEHKLLQEATREIVALRERISAYEVERMTLRDAVNAAVAYADELEKRLNLREGRS